MPMPSASRIELFAPSAAMRYSALTTRRVPSRRSVSSAVTPAGSGRNPLTSVPNRSSASPAWRTAWTRIGSRTSWAQKLTRVGLGQAGSSGSPLFWNGIDSSTGPSSVCIASSSDSPPTSTSTAWMASSRPRTRKISMVRTLVPNARGRIDVPGWRSATSERTPCRASRTAAVRPTEPPPAMSTGTLRGLVAVTNITSVRSAGHRDAVQGVGELFRGGERHCVVTVDLGDRGAIEPAGHPRVPERRPGRHGLVACEMHEGDGQFAVHRAAQLYRFEHRPVGVGDQPLETVPGELLAGGLDEIRPPQLPGHGYGPVGAGGGELADACAHLLGQGVGG